MLVVLSLAQDSTGQDSTGQHRTAAQERFIAQPVSTVAMSRWWISHTALPSMLNVSMSVGESINQSVYRTINQTPFQEARSTEQTSRANLKKEHRPSSYILSTEQRQLRSGVGWISRETHGHTNPLSSCSIFTSSPSLLTTRRNFKLQVGLSHA